MNSIFPYDLDKIPHNPRVEQLTEILNKRTQNTEKDFFRILCCFFLGKIASSMRASIDTADRGNIPINNYTVALAPSGYAKGYAVSVLENEIFSGFKETFESLTVPYISDVNIRRVASKRAASKGLDEEEVYEQVKKEFESAGVIPFTFDSGSVPAIKQLRHALLLGQIGSISLQIDEVASNLVGNTDILTAYLELYDQGYIKGKLTKNTSDNIRREEISGKTPSNMLLFGTPTKLFDGGAIENHFIDFLDIGYARRCFFAYGNINSKDVTKSPEQVYEELVAVNQGNSISKMYDYFQKLADPAMHNWHVSLLRPEAIILISYKMYCEYRAEQLPETDTISKAEMSHRYFKALKLAGVFAFIDIEMNITEEYLLQAIKITEDSGKAFKSLLNRDKSYVRLAKYIASVNTPLTHADLLEALPFYKSTASARQELMTLATAWGYKRYIVIKKKVIDGIELFSGETLKETSLQQLGCSYSLSWVEDFEYVELEFSQLKQLTTTVVNNQRLQWCNHAFDKNYRNEKNAIEGFNLVVIDVDGGIQAEYVHKLFSEYVHFIHTTKRSTDEENRFRLILPLSHWLYLDAEDYRDFMKAIIDWLPFLVDQQTNQRSRKWEAYENATIFSNDEGKLLDVLSFIPHTTKYQQAQAAKQQISNLSCLEKWFYDSIDTVGRNNQMLKYAFALYDSGMSHVDIQNTVKDFNKKLPVPLTENELNSTVFVSLAKKFI